MSADWIKMRVDLQRHPKTVRILSALGTDKFRVVGALHAVWSIFDTYTVDGILRGYTPGGLDEAINWPGFAAALIEVNWLIVSGDYELQMPEFTEHNGQSAKRRAEDQKRKRDARRDAESVQNLSGKDADKVRTKSGLEKEKEKEYKQPTTGKPAVNGDAVLINFEEIWKAYPARPGKSKADTLKQYRARLKSGVFHQTMLNGVVAYAAYCAVTGMEANFIKQPQTFLGPGQHFLSDWSPMAGNAAKQGQQSVESKMHDRSWADPVNENNGLVIEGQTNAEDENQDADRD